MLPQPGDIFARRYRVVREVGRGAMGVVYEAEHATLGSRVAIKILRPTEPDDGKAVRRFEREAKIAAKLDSAHVVKVLDVDRSDDGTSYLVMELLDGRDLAAELDARENIPIEEAISWMRDVCAAMQSAHAAGVIHRDLKLSNVFLTNDGQIKVLDFGVAALQANEADRSTTSVAGTPRYMAPEQLLGEAPHPASDVWAIGVMLYRILGGRFPYDAPTMAGQMLAIMDGCPPLHSVADVSPELSAAIDRALGRTLEDRWPSVADLAKALAGKHADHPVTSKLDPRTRTEEARPERRGPRSRAWLAAAVSAVGVVIVAFAAMRRQAASTTASAIPDAPAPASSPAAAPASRGSETIRVPPPTSASGPASIAPSPSSSTITTPPPPSTEARAIVPSSERPRAGDASPKAPSANDAAKTNDDGFPKHL